MTISRLPQKKTRAQAMVEFALALPLLLLLIYGMLETGRLIFIYSSTVTAARQAVRYGSATGESPNGVPYYRDCVGITAAAEGVGFINDFSSVVIDYDEGPGTTAKPQCPNYTTVKNGDRIRVVVEAEWVPIVPIVPLDPFTIRSESARTILASVAVQVTAPAIVLPGANNGILSITVTPSSQTYTYAGEVITYTYTLSNTGGADLSAPFVITDSNIPSASINCPNGILPAGGSITCIGTYTITQANMDAGLVTNTATATANGQGSVNTATATITVLPNPSLALSINPDPDATSIVGSTITYTYTLTNDGNVSVSAPYTISDNKTGAVTCPGTPAALAPGQSVVCAKGYQVTNADVTAGEIVNEATGTATFNSNPVTSPAATAKVYTTRLYIVILPSVTSVTAKDQIITYTYRVRNISDVTYNGLVVTSSRTPAVTCPSTTITPGSAVECTGTYTVTETDINNGVPLVTTATAAAEGGTVTSNEATNTVLIQQNALLTLTIAASPSAPVSPAATIPAGTSIAYTFTITNTGNTTLKAPISITDDRMTVTCADQSDIPAGATRDCTAAYTVTQTDVDAGSIVNKAKASANTSTQTIESPEASFTVITFSGARLTVGLTASPTVLTQSGTSVQFTYTITNTGGVPLTSPYQITHTISITGQTPQNYTFNCNGASPLAPGASTTCQNAFTVSNAITNRITGATALNGAQIVNASNLPVEVTVPSTICTSGTLTLSNPQASGSTVTWTISNNIGSPLNLQSISVQWSITGQRYLENVQLSTPASVFSGSDKDGFALFTGSWNIPIGNTTLTMIFSKTGVTVTDMNLTFVESGCGPLNNP